MDFGLVKTAVHPWFDVEEARILFFISGFFLY